MISQELTENILNYDIDSDTSDLQAMIALAEDVDFSIEQSEKLYPYLLNYAVDNRNRSYDFYRESVYSAIRTSMSMIPINDLLIIKTQIENLLENNNIDTRITIIKMIGNIFEENQPENSNQYEDLSFIIYKTTEKILEQEKLDEVNFAIIGLSIYALSGMASDKVLDLIHNINSKNGNLVFKFEKKNLYKLMNKWKNDKKYPKTIEKLKWIMNLMEYYYED